jgi:hypothetical protein
MIKVEGVRQCFVGEWESEVVVKNDRCNIK